MKKLTAMQEIIDYLENNSLIDKQFLIKKCKSKLEKEKQQIFDCYDSGFENPNVSAQQYYNETFKK